MKIWAIFWNFFKYFLEFLQKICQKFGLKAFFLFSFAFGADIEEIRLEIEKELRANFSQIKINLIDLQASLPKDFENYEFLRLAPARLDKASGFVRAEFKTPSNIQKNIFFNFFIRAEIEALKSTRNIEKGGILGIADYEKVFISFDKAPKNLLFEKQTQKLIAKSNIKKGAILRENLFKNLSLIKKNDHIQGLLNEGTLSVLVELVALENGNLNEKIRAKDNTGRVFQGFVIDKKRIRLQ